MHKACARSAPENTFLDCKLQWKPWKPLRKYTIPAREARRKIFRFWGPKYSENRDILKEIHNTGAASPAQARPGSQPASQKKWK